MSIGQLVMEPGLAHVEADGVVYLARLPRGPITVLDGTAAIIWRAALGRTRAEAVQGLADAWQMDRSTIEQDVTAFIGALIERDLLQERPGVHPRV